MNSPFGRLSLWIIIATVVLLLGGCAPPGQLLRGHSSPSTGASSFALLNVPRKEFFTGPKSFELPVEEIPLPVIAPDPQPSPQPLPAGNEARPGDRVATTIGGLRWRPPQERKLRR
ncbi:MAG: hypothetical protein MPJ50_06640 [Pirellulales bacterium]|nr:hypothetical protein [Pirellulales bacterium]